ncbi:MAG TPA: GPR1/FUN34/YaaH family transporter [Streptosporangiaceae bacterium]|nr:GPR1/FUN34/YaaH family transporter [Streptosporangiaceae bacterium]
MTDTAAEKIPATAPAAPATAAPALLRSDPAMIGIPNVIAGATGLGLVTVGAVPAHAAGAALPILLSATSIGMLIATIWAAALGQNMTATIYGTIFGFYISYVALSLGLDHSWYAIPTADAPSALRLYLICWLVTIGLLTLTTLRMPAAFPILFTLVDIALALLLAGSYASSAGLDKAGGYVVLAFVAEAIYLYVHVMEVAHGAKGLLLGRPLLGRA